MILAAFASGAAIGLFFHREGFLGGYGSFRRRILRLGHIALAALGMIIILFAVSVPADPPPQTEAASVCFMVGGLAMPAVCFLSAWRMGFRHLFFIPVTALIAAAVLTLQGGAP
jgi:hypothetical protein